MRRSVGEKLAIIGPVLVIVSVLWEYVRMKPDYRFIVEPWSMRGYEITQGRVFVILGVALLLMGLAVRWKGSSQPMAGAAIAGYAVVVAVAVAAAFANDKDIEGALIRVLAAFLVGLIAATVVSNLISGKWSGWARFLAFVGGAIIAFVTLGDRVSLTPAIGVGVGMALLMAWAIISEPRALSANRAFMLATLAVSFSVGVSSGSIRSRMISEQLATIGIGADFKDVQITSGWLLANLGLLLTLVGSIAMWAKRRDLANAQARAANQRKAAEESAAEIAASF